MDKNTIVGFVLIALVLVGFGYWSRPSKTEAQQAEAQQARQQQEDSLRSAEEAERLAQQREAARLEADSNGIFFQHRTGTARDISLSNGKVSLNISTKGGTVTQAQVLGYKDQQGNDVTLLAPQDNSLAISLEAKTENIRLQDLYFRTLDETDSTVTMRLNASNGGILDIRYRLRPASYMLDIEIQAQRLEGLFPPSLRTMDIDWSDRAKQQEKGHSFENRYSTLTYQTAEGSTKKLSETKDAEKTPEEALDWVACKNQFFSAILIAHQDLTHATLTSKPLPKGSGYLKEYRASMQTAFDPSGAEPTTMQMYLGPNDFHILHASNKLSSSDKNLRLQSLVYFGWPVIRWINRYFTLYLFDFLRSLGLSMGIVLLLLTLIVKALVYPATRKSYLSGARMRVLKPEIDKLNAKYPNKEDAMKKQQETMHLYSQYGVSPMGGCLPMLIQMPVWIALFNFVPNAIELRGQSFLWVSDLSTYDTLVAWHRQIWLLGDHISLFSLLFALTNVANTWISMKQQQATAMSQEQEQQMKMMRWMMYAMPIFFFFIFNDYSAGLCYYYFLSGLTSILIMWGLRRLTDDEKLLAQLKAYRAKHQSDAKKPGSMAARLEAMQKLAEERQRQQKSRK